MDAALLENTMQSPLVNLVGDPTEASVHGRFLAANATNSSSSSSTFTNGTNANSGTFTNIADDSISDIACITLNTLSSTNTNANGIFFNSTENVTYGTLNDIINADKYDVFCWKEDANIDFSFSPTLSPAPTSTPTEKTVDALDIFLDAMTNSSEMYDEEYIGKSDGEIIRQTFQLYGTFFVICLTIFCVARRVFPKPFNLRSGWVDEEVVKSTPMAKNPEAMGWVAWIWRVWLVSDTELCDECGMDALCLSRVLEWGCRITAFGSVLGAAVLMPVYWTAGGDHDGEIGVERLNTSNVPNGSDAHFAATVVAAYLIFGYVMLTTLEEFEWFYRFRYEFLSRNLPRNYVVYVRNLPKEFRTRRALIEYFSHFEDPFARLGGEERRVERLGMLLRDHANNKQMNPTKAWVTLKTPRLRQLVEKRTTLLSRLEHEINVQNVCDRYPKTRCDKTGQVITLVDALFAELKEYNAEIKSYIEKIEFRAGLENPYEYDAEDYRNPYRIDGSENGDYTGGLENSADHLFFDTIDLDDDENDSVIDPGLAKRPEIADLPASRSDEPTQMEEEDEETSSFTYNGSTDKEIEQNVLSSFQEQTKKDRTLKNNIRDFAMTSVELVGTSVGKVGKVADNAANVVGAQVGQAANVVGNTVVGVANVVGDKVGGLVPFLGSNGDDGLPMTAGFVAFSTLKACQAAKQMVHSREVFGMEVQEAPGFDDIFWQNVGKTHKELQMGLLMSTVLTGVLCIFWTGVMAGIGALSSVQGLTLVIPSVGELLEKVPWLELVLDQIAPLMVLFADEFLKFVLEALSGLEGPVSGMEVQASLFSKFSTFKIIQTFFVQAVSGSLISQLSAIAQNPSEIVTLVSFFRKIEAKH
jgi:hypothetical protein